LLQLTLLEQIIILVAEGRAVSLSRTSSLLKDSSTMEVPVPCSHLLDQLLRIITQRNRIIMLPRRNRPKASNRIIIKAAIALTMIR